MTVTEFLFGWISKTPQNDTLLDIIVSWTEGFLFLGFVMFAGDISDAIKKHHDNKE